ncbi:MAG: caspase family protein [bacterium]
MKTIFIFILILSAITAWAVQPAFYAIVVGVSNYSGDGIDLKYASHDAECVTTAFKVCAGRLFGANTHIYTLSSENKNIPTKQNIARVFTTVQNEIKKDDVLLVYFAGHGIITDGVDGNYCFLTSDARSFAGLDDPGVRKITAITISEIKEWVANMSVDKKAIIFDTCAAGNAVDNLMGNKDLPGRQAVLDKLKTQQGLYILMGCAADSRSYETSKYGQGLLTYALLQGIKGAALEKNNVVDVAKLFNYASERVPELAVEIGGIQKPLISVNHGVSFAIGMMTEDDKVKIPLESEKEVIVTPVIMNPDVIGDPLHLSQNVEGKLKKITSVVYIDAEKYPKALMITGFYTVDKGVVTVQVKVFRDEKLISEFSVTGEDKTPDKIADNIITIFTLKLIDKK